VVPAAGRSLRMGTAKLLLPWGQATVIEAVLERWRASRVDRLVVTVRADDHRLTETCRRAGAEVVVVDPAPADMRASIQAGLAHVADRHCPTAADVWLVAPADAPALASAVIDRLLSAHRPEAPRVVRAMHQGRGGHPVLLPWAAAAELGRLAAQQGLNQLVKNSQPIELECGAEALCADLDTPDDYRRLLGNP
jgi:molybdenum cofactor cytidylyltransferase